MDLTPRQAEIRDSLLGLGQDRPRFAPALAQELRARLDADLAALDLGEKLVVSKHAIQAVLDCEGRYRSQLYEPFAWSVQNVRGKVAHRAIERLVISGQRDDPLGLTEAVMDHFASTADDEPGGPGDFLRAACDADRDLVLGEAGDAVTKFAIDWPPISRRWTPRVESTTSYPLRDGMIELRGRVDLALGRPEGNEARVLVVDLKTGREYPNHIHDVRFYALVETLARGVPPFRVASYYLESGTFRAEDVSAETLEVACRRTVDAVRLIQEIHTGREPQLTPNPSCDWCGARHDCGPGGAWLADRRARQEAPDLP
ncbi:MAG: PD-(D/E)XK nuclease family protein [Acidimicrobiia bacterium]